MEQAPGGLEEREWPLPKAGKLQGDMPRPITAVQQPQQQWEIAQAWHCVEAPPVTT